ncbi:pyrroline-5-carboxylate reductase [Verrucomicrobiota bacterium]
MSKSELKDRKFVFIGAGNMAEALVRGMLRARLCPASAVRVTDIDGARLKKFASEYQVAGSADNADEVKTTDVVVLAVKPQVLPEVLKGLKGSIPAGALVVSIAAGISIRALEGMLADVARVIRVMPNTPALVGCGAAAFCCGSQATEEDARVVSTMFKSVGIVIRVEEPAMDAVTALSGSGPAYVFYLVEAMLKAGAEMGLDQLTASALTLATIEGAAHMLVDTGLGPAGPGRKLCEMSSFHNR